MNLKKASGLLFSLALLIASPGCLMQKIRVTGNAFVDKERLPHGFSTGLSFCIIPPKNKNALFAKEIANKLASGLKQNGYQIAEVTDADYILTFDFDMDSSKETKYISTYSPGQSIYTNTGFSAYISGASSYIPTEYTLFQRSLSVDVFEAAPFRESEALIPVWQMCALSSGENADIRKIMDYLLASIFKRFGRDSQECVSDNWNTKNLNLFNIDY